MARHIYRWWDGDIYRQESFSTKAEKADFMAEIRRRRRLGLPLNFTPAEPDPRLDHFIEDYWRLHALPNLEPKTRAGYLQLWEKWIRERIGSYTLGQLNAKIIVRQLAEPMRRAGAGDPTIRNALVVLQSILAYAVAEERIDVNAAAKVKKPPQHVTREVPAIAPAQIEQLRARLAPRDAAIVSLLAYQGLRPEELLALDVDRHVGPGGLSVRRKAISYKDAAASRWVGEIKPYTKTRRNRVVKWTAPQIHQDVREYLLATGIRRGLLFPKTGAGPNDPWLKHDWDNWRDRVYQPAASAVGIPDPRPYDLRGAFVSLLAWEGYTMLEVARRAGHSVQTCDTHYAKIFDDVDPAKRVTAEQAIRAAREPGVAGVTRLFDIGGS